MSIDFRFVALPVGAGVTVQMQVQSSPDNATWTTLLSTDAVPAGSFTSASPSGPSKLRVPSGASRYLRLFYVVSGGVLTTGAVTAGLVESQNSSQLYPRAAWG